MASRSTIWRLYHAALQHFGSWRLALEAAGVNPDNILAYSKEDRPSVTVHGLGSSEGQVSLAKCASTASVT